MVRKFYEADGDNAYGFNTSSSLPSGGRTFEQILEDYHVQLEDNRRDESIKLAAEKYASQYAHQQPVQGYSREDIIALLDWLTKEDSPYAVCYGSETRFATNQDDLTTEQVFEVWNKIYGHIQQPVHGYSMEQVNEAMDKIETMEALENTMKPQYQQPVHDGCKKVHNIEDAPKYLGDG